MTYDDNFDTWVDQWDKAVKSGLFDEPNKQEPPKVNSQTTQSNFFGQTNYNTESKPSEPDTKYWNDVYKLSKEYGNDPNALDDYLNGDLLQEETQVDTKQFNKSMAYSPNPVRPSSVGKDQDIRNPVSVGATYDVADLEGLNNLKLKLHDLLSKLNSMEGRSLPGSPKLESQINALQRQIDELSDGLSKGIPSSQGD